MLDEKRLLLTATGLFAIFTVFTGSLFSMITVTSTLGFAQLVDGGDSYYLIQQASAQEEVTGGEEPTGEVDQPPTEEPPPSPPPCERTTAGCPDSLPPTQLEAEPNVQQAVPEEGATAAPTTPSSPPTTGPALPFVPFSGVQEGQQPTTPTNQTRATNETTGLTPGCVTNPTGTIYCPYVPPTNGTISILPPGCVSSTAGIFCPLSPNNTIANVTGTPTVNATTVVETNETGPRIVEYTCISNPNDPKAPLECICSGAKDCLDLELSGRCEGHVVAGEVLGSCTEKKKR